LMRYIERVGFDISELRAELNSEQQSNGESNGALEVML
jgi:hypothetical protein